MDCAVIYSEVALADLQQITAFIAKDNAEVAGRFANRLVDLAESLRSLPERGRPVKKWPDVRVIVLAPYLIFYHYERTARLISEARLRARLLRKRSRGGRSGSW
jgi:plasmid stabilization system protein ParE